MSERVYIIGLSNRCYVGENSIVIIGGANGCLATDDVMNASSLVTAAKVVVCQLEVPLATTTAALKMARQHGGMCNLKNYTVEPCMVFPNSNSNRNK